MEKVDDVAASLLELFKHSADSVRACDRAVLLAASQMVVAVVDGMVARGYSAPALLLWLFDEIGISEQTKRRAVALLQCVNVDPLDSLGVYAGDLPAQEHSDTSKQARSRVRRSAVSMRQRVFQTLKQRGSFGATDEEIHKLAGLGLNSVRPRRRELQLAGMVVDSKERRKTDSGSKAVVWVATEGAGPGVSQ